MTKYRALLLGSVCFGIAALQVHAKDEGRDFAQALKLHVAKDALGLASLPLVVASKPGEEGKEGVEQKAAAPASPAPAAAEAPTAPAETPSDASTYKTEPGVTIYFGDTAAASGAPFSAEAKMNPDYSPAAPAAEGVPEAAPAAPAEAAPASAASAEATPSDVSTYKTEPGATIYYGETAPAAAAPFSADAKMNPDYSPQAAPAAAEAPPAAPASDVSTYKTAPGATIYFGETAPASGAPFSAEAKMNPDYKPGAASAPPAEPAKQVTAAACRDALNAAAQSGAINFATSSWGILPDSYKTLDKIAKIAKDCSAGLVIEVGGHTDNTGKAASNKTISELRAQTVMKYLEKAGVASAKLKAAGYGQDKPVADNATPDGRRKNRRIEFQVSGG